jgi:hypothetical protein
MSGARLQPRRSPRSASAGGGRRGGGRGARAQKDGQVDPYSQHGSCPVKHGEKWTATVWTRGKNRFDPLDKWKESDVINMCYS